MRRATQSCLGCDDGRRFHEGRRYRYGGGVECLVDEDIQGIQVIQVIPTAPRGRPLLPLAPALPSTTYLSIYRPDCRRRCRSAYQHPPAHTHSSPSTQTSNTTTTRILHPPHSRHPGSARARCETANTITYKAHRGLPSPSSPCSCCCSTRGTRTLYPAKCPSPST